MAEKKTKTTPRRRTAAEIEARSRAESEAFNAVYDKYYAKKPANKKK